MERNTKIAAVFAVSSVCGQSAMGILEIHYRPLGLLLAAITAVSMAYLAWLGMNWLRSCFGRPEIKLEPIHLIVFGLLIAAAGVGWQWQGGSRAAAPAAETAQSSAPPEQLAQAELNSARQQLAAAQQKLKNFNTYIHEPVPREVLRSELSGAALELSRLPVPDRSRISDVFHELAQLIEEGGTESIKDREIERRIRQDMRSGKISETAVTYNNELAQLSDEAKAYEKRFTAFINRNKYYEKYISQIITDNAINDMMRGEHIDNFRKNLGRWEKIQNKSDPDIAQLLDAPFAELTRQTDGFEIWRMNSDRRLQTLKEAL